MRLWLCLFFVLLPLSLADDQDSTIRATDEQKEEAKHDKLNKYFNISDLHTFPTWEEMEKKVGKFEDVPKSQIGNHDFAAMTAWLKRATFQYPNLTRLYSVGKSVQGRDLWVLLVSRYPNDRPPLTPEVKIVANMHGNEVVGRETSLYLIDILLRNYGKNKYLTRLVDNLRIHIMPGMNPDGYEMGTPGDRMGDVGRSNANNIDLNRNFPTLYPHHREASGGIKQEPETLAVMKWFKQYPFVLSSNLHGGSLVASYGWDDSETGSDGIDTPTADDKLMVQLAYRYARAHPSMHLTGRRCGTGTDSDFFHNGVTNGAGWYHLAGGMQDWQYEHTNTIEITVEMGCYKFPTDQVYSKIWDEHKYSQLAFLETALGGVRGRVVDGEGHPVFNASVRCAESGKTVYTTENGEYWRLLTDGAHKLYIDKEGMQRETVQFSINGSDPVVRNVTLHRNSYHLWIILAVLIALGGAGWFFRRPLLSVCTHKNGKRREGFERIPLCADGDDE